MMASLSSLYAAGAALLTKLLVAARLLTGDALALADVELLIAEETTEAVAGAGADGPTTGAAGAATGAADPPLAVDAGAALPGDVPLMLFVASFTSWNFSMNCKQST